MNLKLKISGYALLAAYTLLLLHSLIPHYHTNDQGHIAVSHENAGHHHDHHHHNSEKANSHDHTSHSDHSDHNAFDLLIYSHEETEHTASGIDHTLYQHSETRASFINTISGANDFALLTSFFSPEFADKQKIDFPCKAPPDYQPPQLFTQPARGPPLFS